MEGPEQDQDQNDGFGADDNGGREDHGYSDRRVPHIAAGIGLRKSPHEPDYLEPAIAVIPAYPASTGSIPEGPRSFPKRPVGSPCIDSGSIKRKNLSEKKNHVRLLSPEGIAETSARLYAW